LQSAGFSTDLVSLEQLALVDPDPEEKYQTIIKPFLKNRF
jgi:hypothetical protein